MSEIAKLMEEFATIAEYVDAKEKEIEKHKKVMNKIKAALLAALNAENMDNAKSRAGHSVCRVQNNSCRVVDGAAFHNFVLETGDTSFLTKHVAADAVADYLKKHNQLPPGVELTSAITLRLTLA